MFVTANLDASDNECFSQQIKILLRRINGVDANKVCVKTVK